jgi:phosphocarrier protein
MSEKKVVVCNVDDYENPFAEIVQVACQFDSRIILESDDKRINAKSIMGIMAFNPRKGMSINIVAEGDDENEALIAMEKFLAAPCNA